MEFRNDDHCFACGKQNPIGLKLEFIMGDNDVIRGTFCPNRVHQGYDGIVHGGILATLVDESMAQLLKHKGVMAVTATLEMKYRRPALVGEMLRIEARPIEIREKTFRIEAKLENAKNEVVAEGNALFMRITQDRL